MASNRRTVTKRAHASRLDPKPTAVRSKLHSSRSIAPRRNPPIRRVLDRQTGARPCIVVLSLLYACIPWVAWGRNANRSEGHDCVRTFAYVDTPAPATGGFRSSRGFDALGFRRVGTARATSAKQSAAFADAESPAARYGLHRIVVAVGTSTTLRPIQHPRLGSPLDGAPMEEGRDSLGSLEPF